MLYSMEDGKAKGLGLPVRMRRNAPWHNIEQVGGGHDALDSYLAIDVMDVSTSLMRIEPTL